MAPEASNDLYLNAEEAARLVKRAVQTLAHWRRHGRGPSYTKSPGSRRVLYLRSDLLAWLESGRVKNEANCPYLDS